MRGESKAPVQMGKQKNTLVRFRMRFDLTRARKTTPLARKKAIVLVVTDLLRRDDRRQPLSRRHGVLAIRKKSVDTNSSGGRRRGVEGARAKESKRWGMGRGRMKPSAGEEKYI